MYTPEMIKQAENVDIVNYCEANGISLKRDSERYYRLSDHNSCVIDRRKNTFYWNSRSLGGNVITFVREVDEVGFKEAMQKLLDEKQNYQQSNQVEYVIEPYEYDSSKESDDFSKARNYLVNERKIDAGIVDDLNEKGLIKQDKRNNVLFLWKDYDLVMGANEQGTIRSDKFQRGSWKSTQKNSTSNCGFNVTYGEPKNLKFFESSIDALSYMSLNKDKLSDTQFVSMEGLKPTVVFNYLVKAQEELNDAPDSVSICVDNDKAGKEFAEKFNQYIVKKKDGTKYEISIDLPEVSEGKDWNEQLKKKSAEKEVAPSIYKEISGLSENQIVYWKLSVESDKTGHALNLLQEQGFMGRGNPRQQSIYEREINEISKQIDSLIQQASPGELKKIDYLRNNRNFSQEEYQEIYDKTGLKNNINPKNYFDSIDMGFPYAGTDALIKSVLVREKSLDREEPSREKDAKKRHMQRMMQMER